MDRSPVRLTPDRIRLYGIALAIIGIAQLRFSPSHGYWDWGIFRAAGQSVGSAHLLGDGFVYTPAFAWLLAPAAHVSLAVGFWINAVLMLAAIALCASVATKAYALPPSFAVFATIAWTPVMYAIVVGQNAPIALLLYLVAIWAYCDNKLIVAGLAIGALLYKPTFAAPLILLVLFRRDWRVLATVCVCAVAWYAASAAAVGWNWLWPTSYVHSLAAYYSADFSGNAIKALSIPSLLMRLGVPSTIAAVLGAIVLLAGTLRLSKANPLAAISLVGALGVACSPHAWTYDAAMILPALLYSMTSIAEPLRTRVIIAAYILGAGWLLENALHFNTLALVAIAGAVFAVQSSDRRATR